VDVIVLAVRDGQLSDEVQTWLAAGVVPMHAVVLHMAGAFGPDILEPLRSCCRGVGQLHPLVSIASHRSPPELKGAFGLVSGDPGAQRAARRILTALGMNARKGDTVDRAAYHAAAWLVAGGTAALCQAARDILSGAGIAPREAEHMLAPLVRSVGSNVDRLGLPHALTGIVRRGDLATLRRHVHVLKATSPEHLGLYLVAAQAQIGMARTLGDVASVELDRLEAELIALARDELG
jgi:predicted short-subunit dehydrogenase-like oxidoreductase (DUF2520 family)